MCFPGAEIVVAAIIAAATAANQADTARKTRHKAERFRVQQEELSKRNALQAQVLATENIHAQQIADQDAASREIQGNRREATRAMATATTAAGEIGAFGLSYQGLIGEFARQQAEFEGQIATNLAVKNQVAELQMRGAALDKDVRFINATTQRLPKVNYVNYAMGGLSSYFKLRSNLDFS